MQRVVADNDVVNRVAALHRQIVDFRQSLNNHGARI